jgi:uncharacterized protein
MERSTIEKIFTSYRHIAIIGISDRPERASNSVARYMMQQGFTIYPVNPNLDEVLGLHCYPSLESMPQEVKNNIEIVNIFRKSAEVPPIIDQAISIGAKVIWMQSGISNNTAAAKARNAGLLVIENSCIAVDHQSIFH